MKYIFFGTPEFAAIVLEKLIVGGFIPTAVVCNPDRPVGRKKIITAPAVKQLIREKRREESVQIFQPEDLSSLASRLSPLHPDLFIVASYAKIIPSDILNIPRLGAIGVHPSLLPKYRGASPIQSAILNGENESGVTLYRMDEKMDHGPILASAKRKEERGKSNYAELQKELAALGGDLLVETLPKFIAGKITPREQDHTQATFTKKFTTEDGFVAEHDLLCALRGEGTFATAIERKIRALNPEPGAWTRVREERGKRKEEKRVKLLRAHIVDGALVLDEVQIEGKNPSNSIPTELGK